VIRTKTTKKEARRLCECGCGQEVKPGNRFIHGHHAKLRVGWHHTEEAKKKLREKHIGTVISEETKQKMSKARKENPTRYWEGKKFSEEHKKKIRETTKKTYENPEVRLSCGRKGRKILEPQKQAVRKYMKNAWKIPEFRNKLIRERANNWRGGTTFKEYGYEFDNRNRAEIYERDNYTCQNPECSSSVSRIDTHHIDYNKQNHDKRNIVTLCSSCHSKTNFNRSYWKEYYQRLMEDKYAENNKNENSNRNTNE
jgi:hypothetical protein